VLVFSDDDVTFDKRLFAALAEAYAEPELAGATVRVVEHEDGRIGRVGSPLRRLLPDPGRPGTMTRYGYPRRIANPDAPLDVEFMYGCLMTARRELAEQVRFDENLTGYALAEDEDFSYRLSRLGRLRYLPDVYVVHAGSGILGTDERHFNRMLVENRAYLFRKNFERTPLARIQFGLVVALLVAHRLANRSWGGAVGLAEGAFTAWRAR
jgi:GT2 family glycosyltransferase